MCSDKVRSVLDPEGFIKGLDPDLTFQVIQDLTTGCWHSPPSRRHEDREKSFEPVFRIRIHRIHMFLGLLDPDPLVRGMDPDPDPSIFI